MSEITSNLKVTQTEGDLVLAISNMNNDCSGMHCLATIDALKFAVYDLIECYYQF